MKIGIVCYPSIGGSGLVATELGVDLARRGHEVHFISYAAPFKLPSYHGNVFFHSVDPISYPLFNQTLYTFALTAKIIEVAQDYGLQIVHAHYSIPHSLCAHLAREIGPCPFKIVTTLHGTDVTIVGQDKPLFGINKYGIERSDLVTTVSDFQRQHTIRTFGIEDGIRVIHNFVDPEVFKPAGGGGLRPRLGEGSEKVLMHIGNFRPTKNPMGVIKAFNLVQQRVPAHLALVGDGPTIKEIRQACREMGICRKVSFLGQVNNVEHVLPLADCVFQPSYRESFGMVLLEAMACGVPTVSSNVDGIPEVAREGVTGFTAPPDEHDELAEHIVRLFNDDDLRREIGENGRRRALEAFHKDLIVPQYLACYEDVLNENFREPSQ